LYLKRLDIKGFKSFADNTELQLNPGLNIVVGPNGCGKSNIVDAIRWVLGETSIRQLRGQKNEDVIFNGSDKKKALGMALVELLIDNSDHCLPLDFSEITLGRKVHRSGESEFYLNKSRVRLKDISELLSGSGVGKKGYAIISQGELEEVLNGQALDRRLMLEEAAGVIKYRQQRDEVKKRILNSSNDLLRLGDILEELGLRRQELFKKAEKARLYMALNSECQELEKSVLGFELARTEKDWQQKTGDLIKKQDEIKAQAAQVALLEAKLREEEEGLARQQLSLGELGEQRHLLESRLNLLQGEIRLGEERIKNNNKRIDDAVTDEKKQLILLDNIQRDLHLCSRDYDKEQQNMAQRVAEYNELEHEVQELESIIARFKGDFDKKKALVFDKMKQESQHKNELAEKAELLGQAREKKERLKIHIEELAAKLLKGRKGHLQCEEEIRALQAEIGQKQSFIEELSREKDELAEVLQNLNNSCRELNQRSIEINNQLLAIKDLQRNLTGYSPAVKSIIKQARSGRLKGIMGVLGEILEVPAGMELAIDVAAGNGLQNIVVASEKEVREAIDYLKVQELGRATFLPLDVLKVKPLPGSVVEKILVQDGVLGLASRLVHYDNKFAKAVEYLLGRVLLVEDLTRGIRIFRESSLPCRIVSLDGELINVSGAITGGKKASPTQTPLQRRAEEKKLLRWQQENEQAREDKRREQKQVESRWQELEQVISRARNDLLESQFRCDMMMKQKEDLALELLEDERERDGYLEQLTRLDGEVAENERETSLLHRKLGDIEQENQKLMIDLENFKDKMEVKRRDYEVFQERLLSYRKQLDMKGRELENIKKNLSQFKELRASYQQSLDDSRQLMQSLQLEIGREESRMEQFKKELENKTEDLARLSAESREMQEKEKGNWALIEKYRQEIIPARESLARLETGARNLEVATARLEVELEGLKNRWREKFAAEAGLLAEEPLTPGEIREARKRIAILQQQLEAIASVDIDSIREYEETSGRYDFIKQQYDDLSSARDSLDELLQKTEKLMLQDFSRFLLLANESFKNTFSEIFGGGEASLRIEAEVERLEAGVDIEVKMPGKRSQSLNLLSGGERALTCIAFIFSLLRLRPVPFCVLDEIDASLDEVNLQRFSGFITAMSRNLQFIVITHRQATIESGENIYGITMPEEGVSAVLTLNVFEAESLAG
jgi:chromosome segregation protein